MTDGETGPHQRSPDAKALPGPPLPTPSGPSPLRGWADRAPFRGPRDFAGGIRLRLFRWGLSWVPGAPDVSTRVLIRGSRGVGVTGDGRLEAEAGGRGRGCRLWKPGRGGRGSPWGPGGSSPARTGVQPRDTQVGPLTSAAPTCTATLVPASLATELPLFSHLRQGVDVTAILAPPRRWRAPKRSRQGDNTLRGSQGGIRAGLPSSLSPLVQVGCGLCSVP